METFIVRLTREELYEMVWREPIEEIAKRYYTTEWRIETICKNMEIPRPPEGYFNDQLNYKKIIPSLNPVQNTREYIYIIEMIENDGKGSKRRVIDRMLEFEKNPKNKITVSKRMTKQHPLIKNIKKYFEDRRKDRKTIEKFWDCINVSDDSEGHALRLLNSFLIALEERKQLKIKVKIISEEKHFSINFEAFGITKKLRIRESAKKIKIPEDQRDDYNVYKLFYSRKIGIEQLYDWREKINKRWEDTKVKLDEKLNDIIIHLLEECYYDWMIPIRRRLEDQESQNREEIRKEKERIQMLWDKLSDNLLERTKIYDQSVRMRELVSLAEEKFRSEPDGKDTDLKQKWLAWAKEYVERMDPITSFDLGEFRELFE